MFPLRIEDSLLDQLVDEAFTKGKQPEQQFLVRIPEQTYQESDLSKALKSEFWDGFLFNGETFWPKGPEGSL